ncbi:hypothetical protein [Cellulomonas oligotrophica]|uniref:Terminase n=1 Tax=Cellulomonas oligotrophica TaxID=931536 RepID=A0A7Y9K0Z0_9CELL|nr:hypothetical protein [Cellulomonas oligotrophica]NYD87785.1 hypothetical protein [Cellulomonas oligotrophica]GIG33011.1 hypothetical protein Col01nite_21700 [Cellulomonas oligotrophica]
MTASAAALAVPPDFHTAPERLETLGPEVGDLARSVGFAPYPEQQLALDDTFALDDRGRSAAFEVAVVCARQNLKTGFFKQAALGWLFLLDLPLIVWSAHEFDTAQEAFRDMEALIEGSDMLRRRVRKIHRGNGDEAIELLSGARLKFKARTSGGGRGLTGHRVVLDEAFALKPAHMGALLPTLSAVPDPQVLYGSSAGLLASDILRGVRDRGRAGAPSLAYLEWCSLRRPCLSETCAHMPGTAGCVLDDIELWRHANPVHARRDPDLPVVRMLRGSLPPSEFMRECLGWWDDPVGAGSSGIDPADWAARADPTSRRAGTIALGIAQSPDRATVSIGLAGRRADGDVHVELIEHRRSSTTWVAPRVRELVDRHDVAGVLIDPMSPAAGLVPDLEREGIEVEVVRVGDLAAGCGRVFDGVKAETLHHIGGQTELNAAVGAAGVRPLQRGGWLWRQVGEAPIEPLWAITLALVQLGGDYDVMDSIG